ncbi:putative short-chain type dehydrogenase/reductase VdlC [Podospora aff. communis PSN243]|uniref:Short-chain type dehydrogenase/reductase VdlC n=1 Tax=Podospora aff. communis PSN243 TaxID=3040156 RepID=A0AAV9GRC9_9PEZI|nr:putative short-chain type dehydrogenase/reductase VdlC [Podospora aff. communis PSN243]
MVLLSDMRSSLADFKNATGFTAVIVGGTSGIGEAMVRALARHANAAVVYVVGRNAEAANRILNDCRDQCPSSRFEFLQQDIALLKGVDVVCAQIQAREPNKVDLLFMTPDYLSFGGREETPEGLDKVLSLRYYARIRFIHNLLPLLRNSPYPRVISVFAPYYGEFNFYLDDLSLRKHYGLLLATSHASIMTTLAHEVLAARHPAISFGHVFPGAVWTPSVAVGRMSPLLRWFLTWVVRPLAWIFLQGYEECGDRMLFLSLTATLPPKNHSRVAAGGWVGALGTSVGIDESHVVVGSDGERGNGCYCVSSGAKRLASGKRLNDLRAKGAGDVVWQHTMDIFRAIDS